MAKNKIIFRLKKYNAKIRNWIVQNKAEFAVLFIILLIGAYLRLFRISEYMTFLGDEGRDAIVVRRLLVNFDLILVGPGTSIGNMYLGPLYYYLMAPALLLANYSPVGPAVMIALLGVATIFLVWFVAREWFPSASSGQVNVAAIVASLLYAITPVVIIYSRSSWNPNIMPFFAIISIYSIWRVWFPVAKASEGQAKNRKRFRWLIVTGISVAFALQSHYLGLLLLPTLGFFWFLILWKIKGTKDTKFYFRYTTYAAVIFLLLMSPLVIFDARHGWRNYEAIKIFFTQRQATVSAKPWSALPNLLPLVNKISTRLVAAYNQMLGELVGLFTLVTIGILALKQNLSNGKINSRKMSAYFLIFIWLGVALIGLGVYKQEIYDHYYGFFFAAPFLLFGGIAQELYKFNWGRLTVVFALIILVRVNLHASPIKPPPNKQLQRSQEVVEKIANEASGEKINLAVIAERNYEGAYQYFIEKENVPFSAIDPQRLDETLAKQLFVVCELPPEKCDPTHNPKAEIANFGWSKIDEQWQVAGTTLYKLTHVE